MTYSYFKNNSDSLELKIYLHSIMLDLGNLYLLTNEEEKAIEIFNQILFRP